MLILTESAACQQSDAWVPIHEGQYSHKGIWGICQTCVIQWQVLIKAWRKKTDKTQLEIEVKNQVKKLSPLTGSQFWAFPSHLGCLILQTKKKQQS